ncbi:MAG: hypothetical protein NTV86_04050 [Planctomycetota bacterium]|nr:hypothetical protein [Planctomycetota bacterium]
MSFSESPLFLWARLTAATSARMSVSSFQVQAWSPTLMEPLARTLMVMLAGAADRGLAAPAEGSRMLASRSTWVNEVTARKKIRRKKTMSINDMMLNATAASSE